MWAEGVSVGKGLQVVPNWDVAELTNIFCLFTCKTKASMV